MDYYIYKKNINMYIWLQFPQYKPLFRRGHIQRHDYHLLLESSDHQMASFHVITMHTTWEPFPQKILNRIAAERARTLIHIFLTAMQTNNNNNTYIQVWWKLVHPELQSTKHHMHICICSDDVWWSLWSHYLVGYVVMWASLMQDMKV